MLQPAWDHTESPEAKTQRSVSSHDSCHIVLPFPLPGLISIPIGQHQPTQQSFFMLSSRSLGAMPSPEGRNQAIITCVPYEDSGL